MAKQTDPSFKVRLSPEMDEWIEQQAKANHRSKTAEVAFRLEEARRASGDAAAGEALRA